MRGRPTSYDPSYCQQVIILGAQGKSEVQIAASLGVPRTTMRSWAEANPDFSSALTHAKELSQVWWEDQAQVNLANRDFNASLWAKNVASRFRYEYGEKVNIGGDPDNPLHVKSEATPTDMAKAILGLLSRQP